MLAHLLFNSLEFLSDFSLKYVTRFLRYHIILYMLFLKLSLILNSTFAMMCLMLHNYPNTIKHSWKSLVLAFFIIDSCFLIMILDWCWNDSWMSWENVVDKFSLLDCGQVEVLVAEWLSVVMSFKKGSGWSPGGWVIKSCHGV